MNWDESSSEFLDSELLEISSNSVQALEETHESTSANRKQSVCSRTAFIRLKSVPAAQAAFIERVAVW